MTSLLTLFRLFLKKWHWYIGANPDRCPVFSIIIFPLLPSTLCCGLAGILAIKGADKSTASKSIRSFLEFFDRIKGYRISDVYNQKLSLKHYLNISSDLEEMERLLFEIKGDHSFRELFADPDLATALKHLADDMASFLRQEEEALEKTAAFFSTEAMEGINRRITVLRDLVWALEKDVLETLTQIRELADGNGENEHQVQALVKYKKINFLLNCLNRLEVRGRDSAGLQISLTSLAGGTFRKIIKKLRDKDLLGELS
ncbi:MAG: hypothetical protein JW902_12205, partial [Syntrophaceae bacterium]|nr:hypothetical protein [Syntrophaceae bacterium]